MKKLTKPIIKPKILLSMQGTCLFRMDTEYDLTFWGKVEKQFIKIKPEIDPRVLYKTRKWCIFVKNLGLPAPTKVHVRDREKLELEWNYGSSFMLVCISLDLRKNPDDSYYTPIFPM